MRSNRSDTMCWPVSPAEFSTAPTARILPFRPAGIHSGAFPQEDAYEQGTGPRAVSAFLLVTLVGWTAMGMRLARIVRH